MALTSSVRLAARRSVATVVRLAAWGELGDCIAGEDVFLASDSS